MMDIFFVMSGFLITYLILSQAKRLPSFAAYIGLRWMRLAPSIGVFMCLSVWLQKVGPAGPLHHQDLTDPFVKPCRQQWWTQLLFINNLVKFEYIVKLFLKTPKIFGMYCISKILIRIITFSPVWTSPLVCGLRLSTAQSALSHIDCALPQISLHALSFHHWHDCDIRCC